MSYALIVHRETNATNAGAIASSGSVSDFRTRKLTDILVNQQFSAGVNTVNEFRSSSVANPSQFDLINGVYRICAEIEFGQSDIETFKRMTSLAGLYDVTNSRFEYHYGGGTEPIISTAGFVYYSATNANTNTGVCYIDTQFTVSGGTRTYEIRQAVSITVIGVNTSVNTAGMNALVTSGTHKEVYALIRIQKLT